MTMKIKMKAADYSGWYLLSDMDGTLIDSQGSTSEGNRRAIKTFTEGGGLFGIATGRAPNNLGDYLEGLPINAPCVFYNGGAVYDLKNRTFLDKRVLDKESVRPVLTEVLRRFPDAVTEIFTPEMLNIVSKGKGKDEAIERDKMPCRFTAVEALAEEEWIKVLFHAEPELLAKIADCALEKLPKRGFEKFFSGPTYFEILPEGTTKGAGLSAIARLPQYKDRRFAAIGDYDNDSFMLKEADLGIAVANASPQCLASADITGADNDSDALADAIFRILPSQRL